jgi:hypothetical protein
MTLVYSLDILLINYKVLFLIFYTRYPMRPQLAFYYRFLKQFPMHHLVNSGLHAKASE